LGLGRVVGPDTDQRPPGRSQVSLGILSVGWGLDQQSHGQEQSCGGAGDQCSSIVAQARTDGLSVKGLLESCHWRPPVRLKMREDGVVRAGDAIG